MISGNMVGSYSQMGKTLILTDENGNEITGVIVDEEVVFTAGLNDIRAGKIAANAEGVVTGTKDIPAYRTYKESYLIFSGESFSIPLPNYNLYDYTKLQCIIAKFNTTFADSVNVDKITIDEHVYSVNSTTVLSNVAKNSNTKSIDLNIINDSENDYVVHYILYREEE